MAMVSVYTLFEDEVKEFSYNYNHCFGVFVVHTRLDDVSKAKVIE